MSERSNQVRVVVNGGTVDLSWESRKQLLDRLMMFAAATAPIVTRFEAVGTTRPVELSAGEKVALAYELDVWARDLGEVLSELPVELITLRDELRDDLADARESG